MTDKPRIRKSLAALTRIENDKVVPLDERKGYFYCLKLLGVLPPPPGSGFQEWVFYPPPLYYLKKEMEKNGRSVDPYVPKNLHDVLISSHATTCEHNSFYFSFYHRNLMVLIDIFLNFAHQVLRGGFKKLESIYPRNVDAYSHLYTQKAVAAWKEIFDAYSNFEGIPDQVANHYWNPTDFESDGDLSLPEQLTSKDAKDVTDLMDILFFSVNQYYPWQTNVAKRWYQTAPDLQDIEQDLSNGDIGYFQQQDPSFTPDPADKDQSYKKFPDMVGPFQEGKLDPRKNTDYSWHEINLFTNQYRNSQPNNNPSYAYQKVAQRNWNTWNSAKDGNYTLTSITPNESLPSYGAASKGQQYISQEEQNDNNRSDALTFNQGLPHWQLAYALFQSGISGFFQNKTIETSHNQMHNYFQLMMCDANFSVTSFIFWPYHSWIDCEIEMFVRRSNSGLNTAQTGNVFFSTVGLMANTINSYGGIRITGQNPDGVPNLFGEQVIKNLKSQIQMQQDWRINQAVLDRYGITLNENTVGYYPIFEYMSPHIREMIDTAATVPTETDMAAVKADASFTAFDYIITSDQLRTSSQFNDIYQNYYIDCLNPTRFYFLNDIKKFNFNYNYQIGSRPQDLQNLLEETGRNIPQYLAKMESYWGTEKKSLEEGKADAVKYSLGRKGKWVDPLDLPNLKAHEELAAKKVFESGIRVYASHPSSARNGAALINLRFKNILAKLSKQFKDDEGKLKQLERLISNGINLDRVVIFGKGKGAKRCPRCPTNRIRYIDLDEKLRVAAPHIWKHIHLQSLNKVLYDSADRNLKIKCIYDKISLVPNSTFIDYRLIGGAEEIEVEVVSTINSKESQFIRIEAESYSIQQDCLNSVLTKKFTYLSRTKFDFYKIFDVNTKNNRSTFDQNVYKVLKGWVVVGKEAIHFKVRVPCFQRLFRATVMITNIEGEGLRVRVKDTDYYAKKQFYNKAAEIKVNHK